MKNSFLKVATVCFPVNLANVFENVKQIKNSFMDSDAKIVIYPELSLTAYTCADLFNQDTLLKNVEDALIELKEFSKSYPQRLMVVGAPLLKDQNLYNCAFFIQEGEIKWVYPKVNLPNYNEFYEQRWFQSGRDHLLEKIVLQGNEIPFGTNYLLKDGDIVITCEICEDLWVLNRPSNTMLANGANVVINLSASNELISKAAYRRQLVLNQSAIGNCAYLYASSGPGESSTDLIFSGHCILAQNGSLLQESIWPMDTTITTAILDFDLINANRRRMKTVVNTQTVSFININLQDKEISFKKQLSFLRQNNYKVNPYPFVPSDEEEQNLRCQEIMKMQVMALYQRLKATKMSTVVIGISGGLDSTLALLVLYETRKLYKDLRIIGVTMPSFGNTTEQTYQNALKLMTVLKIENREIAIQDMVFEHLRAIGHSGLYKGSKDVTYENAQARMRTYLLMDIANKENGLVIGTGDLSELALGWCTYNGDHMSMYAVNSSIPKTLVKYICKVYSVMEHNKDLQSTMEKIINTPISPELIPHKNGEIRQKTENEIGKYDLNDFFLYHFLRFNASSIKLLLLASLAFKEVKEEDIYYSLTKFLDRFFKQQFKRSCLPDGPKVGSVSLSPRGDWRMPSDTSATMWLFELERIKNE